jgi:predicted DNA binding CopG/RHH family protein
MAQHHKGPRKQVATRIPDDVFAEIRGRSTERGLSMSQFIADILSAAVGRPDLVRELNSDQESLPMAI